MDILPYNEKNREGWKTYPMRIQGSRLSRCCRKPTLLTQSMSGGFVTQNCSACGSKNAFTQTEFKDLNLWVSCPKCRKQMLASYPIVSNNYGFICEQCNVTILLASILPDWNALI